jgi:hypothetical protein
MKLLEESMGDILQDIRMSNDFFLRTSEAQKTKNRKMGLPETKNLHSKGNNRVKTQPT